MGCATLRVVADPSTLMPGTYRNFEGSNIVVMDGAAIVFDGWLRDPVVPSQIERRGIYLERSGGPLQKILDFDDQLDGKPLHSLSLFRGGLKGDRLLVYVTFADLSNALYELDLSSLPPLPPPVGECVLAEGTMGAVFRESPLEPLLPFTNYVHVTDTVTPPLQFGDSARIAVTNTAGFQEVQARAELTVDSVTRRLRQRTHRRRGKSQRALAGSPRLPQ